MFQNPRISSFTTCFGRLDSSKVFQTHRRGGSSPVSVRHSRSTTTLGPFPPLLHRLSVVGEDLPGILRGGGASAKSAKRKEKNACYFSSRWGSHRSYCPVGYHLSKKCSRGSGTRLNYPPYHGLTPVSYLNLQGILGPRHVL